MLLFPFDKSSVYYIYRENRATNKEIKNNEIFRKFEKNCPILTFVEYKNENQYLRSIRTITEKICDLKASDLADNLSKYSFFLKKNSDYFIPKTISDIEKHFSTLNNDFNIKTVFSEFSENLENPRLIMDSFLSIFRSKHLIKDSLCFEEIVNHFFPFLMKFDSTKGINKDFEKNQLLVIEILAEVVIEYPRESYSYEYNAWRIITKLFSIFCNCKRLCNISVNINRVLFNILPDYCSTLSDEEKAAKLNILREDLSNDHPFRILIFKLFERSFGKTFNCEDYFNKLITGTTVVNSMDYKLLLDYMRRVKTMKNPFHIMRNMIQVFFFGGPYAKIAFFILTENLHYFKTCKRLKHWTKRFCRRAFQWSYVASRLNKYAKRRDYVYFCMKKLHSLNIPELNQIIETSASSLIYAINPPILASYFEYKGYQESFGREINQLIFTRSGMKRQLLWPQENPKKSRRSVVIPTEQVESEEHENKYSEYEDDSKEVENKENKEYQEEEESLSHAENDDEKLIEIPMYQEENNSIDNDILYEVDIGNNMPKRRSRAPVVLLEMMLFVYMFLFFMNDAI